MTNGSKSSIGTSMSQSSLPSDEALMQLVGTRIGDGEREREAIGAERAPEERREYRVLGHVSELPQHEIPRPEAGAEAGDRREDEDDARPDDDREPQAERGRPRHRPMIGSAPHTVPSEGTRCKSGTVPPL